MIDWQKLRPFEKIDALKSAYRSGMSAAQLAPALATSRSAVIGLYNRHPSLRKSHPLRDRTPMQRAEIEKSKGRPKLPASPSKMREAQRARMGRAEIKSIPVSSSPAPTAPLNLHLHELDATTCRWPVNDGHPYMFCGHPADGKYCAFHANLSVGRGTHGERAAIKTLKTHLL
jgi:GcrA cell cycle regulator